jgi:hypothetical protein
MDGEPVTLGDWYEILKPSDYEEAARLANKDKAPQPWIAVFLRNWAPELITTRKKWDAVSTRTSVAKQLALVKSLAQRLADALDEEVMGFLELPPYGPFESKLGTRISVGSLAARARDALNSPNLTTGDGERRSGAGRAILPADPDPKAYCCAIIAELFKALHGKYPMNMKSANSAATAYWVASGGQLNSWSGNPDGSWVRYFKQIDDPLLWGKRVEMRRQLGSS